MKLDEQIDALAKLTPGWNNDTEFPAHAINGMTIAFAKNVAVKLLVDFGNEWRVGPLPDGSVRFVMDDGRHSFSLIVAAL